MMKPWAKSVGFGESSGYGRIWTIRLDPAGSTNLADAGEFADSLMPADSFMKTCPLFQRDSLWMMQRRVFAGLYMKTNFPVVSRSRAMSLDSSSPIRSLRVASRDESGERSKRCQTKDQRCPCAVMIDWKLGVASRSMRERIVRTLEKRSITRHPPQVQKREGGERRVPNESQSERA